MEIIKLKTTINDVKKILHFSDVHIRLSSRHDEYREVFEKLYRDVKKLDENSIVVFSGDALHSKLNLSPESVQLASELFKTIADIRPLIVIAGNHDALLNNKNRLDSISPILNNLNHPNIHYLRDSGLYEFGNILFNNISVFDENHVKADDIPYGIRIKYKRIIALFHGPVFGMKTDIGYTISDKSHTTEIFDGCDIAICGDIHKEQTVFIEKDIDDVDELESHLKTNNWKQI